MLRGNKILIIFFLPRNLPSLSQASFRFILWSMDTKNLSIESLIVLFMIFGNAVKQYITLFKSREVKSFCIVDNIKIESLLFIFMHNVVSKYANLLILGFLDWHKLTG